MKRTGLALILASALGAGFAGVASAEWHGSVSAVVDIGYFYDALAPYGYWVTADPYGLVWVPADVPAGWQPYTDGYWTYTDCGWTWVDYEPWGWAPFHYGRWALDPVYGWIWVPDTVWGPAWVAWRVGDGLIGWAPLPPEAHWQIGFGFATGGWRFDTGIGLGSWCFVRDRDFMQHRIGRHLYDHQRAGLYYRVTRDVTNYGYVRDRVIDRSLDPRYVERRTGNRVRTHNVVDRDWRKAPARTEVRGNAVQIFRPRFRMDEANRVMRAPYGRHEDQYAQQNQLRVRQRQERVQIEQRRQPPQPQTNVNREQQLQQERQRAVQQQQQERQRAEQQRQAHQQHGRGRGHRR